ncbi:MAG: class I SAM-dependent methyltransferase [Saprospiraceae bacterium]
MPTQSAAYSFKRYDSTTNRSLKPYSAADEYLLSGYQALDAKPSGIAVYNDQFGFLTCHLSADKPTVVLTSKSQEESIEKNLAANKLTIPQFSNPLATFPDQVEIALVKAPKSLALLELFIQHIAQNSTDDVTVVVAFMTRHFSPKLVEISQKYFENVEQSRAVKKARLLTLTGKKKVSPVDALDTITYNDHEYKQYWGVFSRKHIDYATQYLVENLDIEASDETILDLASGNGVLGKEALRDAPDATLHLIDDSYLAVESAKLNVQGENVHHHYDNNLSRFDDETFDVIVSNPPFHFEYEINIEVPIRLFKECFRCLKNGGNLQVVANTHLNYKTHLTPIFSAVEVVAENDKFIVYQCTKN